MKKVITIWAIVFSLFKISHKSFSQVGSLDTTFSLDGKLTTDFNGFNDGAHSILLQIDGKIIVGGTSNNGSNWDFALARYYSDGTLDTSFDGDGKVVYDFGTGDIGADVALQQDGKIVIVGTISGSEEYTLIRYNNNGTLDSSFNYDGIVSTSVGASPSAILIQPDSKIIVVGSNTFGGTFEILRYNTDGSLDSTFDLDGISTIDLGLLQDYAYDVTMTNDDKIVVVGKSYNGSSYEFAIVRLNQDGSLDSTFDSDGKATTSFGSGSEIAYAVAIQSDQKILVGGLASGSWSDFAIARYNTNGSIDSSFDFDGKTTYDFFGFEDRAYSIFIQSDEKIIISGTVTNTGTGEFGMIRYLPNGTLDITFDFDGVVTTSFIEGGSNCFASVIDGDGKIYLAGEAGNSNEDFAISRYNSCENSFSFQYATACFSYNWNSTTYTSSGIYTDTISNSTGCDSIITLNLTIDTVNISTTNSDSVISATTIGAIYQWLDCDNSYAVISGEINQSFTASVDGNYAVMITENGCVDTSNCVNINTLGISSEKINFNFRAFPNPVNDVFWIEVKVPGKVEIINSIGKIVLSQELTGRLNGFNLINFENGFYLVKFSDGQIVLKQNILLIK